MNTQTVTKGMTYTKTSSKVDIAEMMQTNAADPQNGIPKNCQSTIKRQKLMFDRKKQTCLTSGCMKNWRTYTCRNPCMMDISTYIYFSFRYLYNIQFTVGIYRLYITRYLMTVIRFKYRIQVRRSIVMNIITYTTNWRWEQVKPGSGQVQSSRIQDRHSSNFQRATGNFGSQRGMKCELCTCIPDVQLSAIIIIQGVPSIAVEN